MLQVLEKEIDDITNAPSGQFDYDTVDNKASMLSRLDEMKTNIENSQKLITNRVDVDSAKKDIDISVNNFIMVWHHITEHLSKVNDITRRIQATDSSIMSTINDVTYSLNNKITSEIQRLEGRITNLATAISTVASAIPLTATLSMARDTQVMTISLSRRMQVKDQTSFFGKFPWDIKVEKSEWYYSDNYYKKFQSENVLPGSVLNPMYGVFNKLQTVYQFLPREAKFTVKLYSGAYPWADVAGFDSLNWTTSYLHSAVLVHEEFVTSNMITAPASNLAERVVDIRPIHEATAVNNFINEWFGKMKSQFEKYIGEISSDTAIHGSEITSYVSSLAEIVGPEMLNEARNEKVGDFSFRTNFLNDDSNDFMMIGKSDIVFNEGGVNISDSGYDPSTSTLFNQGVVAQTVGPFTFVNTIVTQFQVFLRYVTQVKIGSVLFKDSGFYGEVDSYPTYSVDFSFERPYNGSDYTCVAVDDRIYAWFDGTTWHTHASYVEQVDP
jgi:hypothetical protein